MITFTTAGAGEMKDRMLADFAKRGEQVPTDRLITGTFHALTLRHYNKHARDRQRLLSPPARAGVINSMISHLAQADRLEYQLALDQYQGSMNPAELTFPAAVSGFIEEYHRKLRAIQAIDLAGTMRECVVGMREGRIPLLPITHLIGDEMQDADEIQLELMLLHAKAGVATTLVADDDQTIYEWRSALGYQGLMRFAKETGAKTITLAENFRSRSEIVSHAQLLISHNNPDRVDKSIRAVRGPGGKLGYFAASDGARECTKIASAIYRYRRPGESVAVLARSNAELTQMEQALIEHQDENLEAAPIAYCRDGPTMWETPEVAALLCLLRALLRGETTDLLPVLGLLTVSASSRSALERTLGSRCGDFLDGATPEIQVSQEELAEIVAFTGVTKKCRRHIRQGEINFVVSDAASVVRAMLKKQPRARPRQIDGLMNAAENVICSLEGPLSGRLAFLSRMTDAKENADAVRLMTLHSSKGLEFDLVFMVNCSALDDGKTLFDAAPERRLFYVGMTRAKDRLVVSYSGKPSKFILESRIPLHGTLDTILG